MVPAFRQAGSERHAPAADGLRDCADARRAGLNVGLASRAKGRSND
jgi:hypothetical protein